VSRPPQAEPMTTTTPVIAWRFWRATADGLLFSPYSRSDVPPHQRQQHLWRGGLLRGRCGWSAEVRQHPGTDAPNPDCDCGVRAVRSLPELLAHDPGYLRRPDIVVGLVRQYGTVLGVGVTPPRWDGKRDRPPDRALTDPPSTLRAASASVGVHLWATPRRAEAVQRRHPRTAVHLTTWPPDPDAMLAVAVAADALAGRTR
jgi:hypothetical protein